MKNSKLFSNYALSILAVLAFSEPFAQAQSTGASDPEIAALLQGKVPSEVDLTERNEIFKRPAYSNAKQVPFSRRYQQQLFGILLSYPKYIRKVAIKEIRILVVANSTVERGEYYVTSNGQPAIILNEQLFSKPGHFDTRLRLGFDLTEERTQYTWETNLLPEDASLAFVFLHEISHHIWLKHFSDNDRKTFRALSWTNEEPRNEKIARFRSLLFKIPSGAAYPGNNKLGVSDLCDAYAALRGSDFVSLYALADDLEDSADSLAVFFWTHVMKKDWRIQLPKQCGDPFSIEKIDNNLREKFTWIRAWLAKETLENGKTIFDEARGAEWSESCWAYRPTNVHSTLKIRNNFDHLKFNPRQEGLNPKLKLGFQKALHRVVFGTDSEPYSFEIGGEGFYHGHILFDVDAYHAHGGPERFQQIVKEIERLAKGPNPNVAIINYLLDQAETVILFHTREGRNPGADVLTSMQGIYPTNVTEAQDAMNHHSLLYRPSKDELVELRSSRFRVPQGKGSTFDFTKRELEEFIVSGMWNYTDPLSERPDPEHIPNYGGYYYPYEWALRLSVYFYIDQDFVMTIRGLREDDPLFGH